MFKLCVLGCKALKAKYECLTVLVIIRKFLFKRNFIYLKIDYLGELTELDPGGSLLPRGGSFTKFRHDASLFSSACKRLRNDN